MAQNAIDYGVAENIRTGDIWAIKYANGSACGVRKFAQKDAPTKTQLPELMYDVGDDLDYFKQVGMDVFAIWPFLKEQ